LNHGPGCERDPDRRPVWLTAAPQELTLAGQAGPARCWPLSPRRSARSSIAAMPTPHCSPKPRVSNTSISTSSLLRTIRPPSFRGPFAFAPLGGDTDPGAGGRPGIRPPANSQRLRAHARCPGPRDEEGQPPAPPQARRAAACTATSGMESKAVRHPRKPPIPQISRFCMRTLATTAGIFRGQNGGYLRAGLRPPPVIEGDPVSGRPCCWIAGSAWMDGAPVTRWPRADHPGSGRAGVRHGVPGSG
jgi:hypothetical protein